MSRSIWISYLIYCCLQSIHGKPAFTEGEKDQLSLTQKDTDECILKSNQRHVNVLPGTGWDNLVNEERGPVIDRERYTRCRNSIDGQYVVPDDMFVEPQKSSKVDLTSEIFDSTSSSTSLTAFSVNAAVEADFSYYKISGDFSYEKEALRTKSRSSKGLIVRSQIRHKRYTVQLLPDSTLHPRFRNRMLDIVAHLRRGNVTVELIKQLDKGIGTQAHLSYEEAMRAFYFADLVVRDYGTHAIQSVDAGGILVKTDSLDEKSVGETKADREKLSSSATTTFASLLKVKVGGSFEMNDTVSNTYSKRVVHSLVASYGGPIFRAYNMNLSEWESGLDNQLVVIDRSGTPIHELISARSLPELNEDIALRLSLTLKSAVERYYTANVVIGCMDETSIHYDSNANVAASECKESGKSLFNESERLPLGGIFQRCGGLEELCQPFAVKNPATGDFTCPQGYLAVQLLTDQVRQCVETCERHWWRLWIKTCHTDCAITELLWCSLDPTQPKSTTKDKHVGFVFGGFYTDKEINPITQRFACPEYSWPLQMGQTMHICLSTDRELAGVHEMRFGGLYSCRFGNPLVGIFEGNDKVNTKLNLDALRRMMQKDTVPMTHSNNMLNPSPIDSTNTDVPNPADDLGELFATIWPKRCPNGFAAHLAATEDNCAVNYCVLISAVKSKQRRHLKRPPFIIPPSYHQTIVKDVQSDEMMDEPLLLSTARGGPLERIDGIWTKYAVSAGSTESQNQQKIIIALGVTLAVVLAVMVAIGVIVLVLWRRRLRNMEHNSPKLLITNEMNGE